MNFILLVVVLIIGLGFMLMGQDTHNLAMLIVGSTMVIIGVIALSKPVSTENGREQ